MRTKHILVAATLVSVFTAAYIGWSGAVDRPMKPATQPGDEASLLFGEEPKGPPRPTPHVPDGHPDLSGFWKGSSATKPVGNIGKDLPGHELPLTPAGEAALKHNLTATIDPEALCIIGGIPRHSASALPFEIVQNKDRVVFLYMYTYFRSIPTDGRRHTEDPDPSAGPGRMPTISISSSQSTIRSTTRIRSDTPAPGCWVSRARD
jgi:hypothetical protein